MAAKMRWSIGASSRDWPPSRSTSKPMKKARKKSPETANEEVRAAPRIAGADALAQSQARGASQISLDHAGPRSWLCARDPDRGADFQKRQAGRAARRGDA